jgi:hypothetical protein
LNIITLDFETYFDQEYNLSKMTTEAYVRDPRFEVHGVALRSNETLATNIRSPAALLGMLGAGRQYWACDDGVRAYLNEIKWDVTACLCHHAHFDGLILAHHYGIRPAAWLDTLSMARMMLGNHVSVSLDSVRKHFGMPLKSTPYDLFKGRHWDEITSDVQQRIAEGACDEVESIYQIFLRLMG